ncbi:membrane protein [marine sediment metagenome]|uniref:Membrane protein n=1 Tax=marine sediment metagenome TaxID=412755 RepID=A0A1B6NYK8_9ZZZZ
MSSYSEYHSHGSDFYYTFYFFKDDSNYILINFRWFFTVAGITAALLAQIYFKLQDTKYISNASVSELNRITDLVKEYSRPVMKLIFFHLFFGVASNIAFSLKLIPTADAIATSIALSCIPLWGVSLFFGYVIYDEITSFSSDLTKRNLERTRRQEALEAMKK